MGLYFQIKELYPGILGSDFRLQDDSDGKGAYIKEWKSVYPKPTQTELDSVSLTVSKKLAIPQFKRKAQEEILAVYPIHKQININALQGYTQVDKDAMWQTINNIRNKSNNLEAQVNSATTVAEVEAVVW
ncbi:MAG: hypothetical protein HY096_00265 [Nitrospinae bacterium]|nr:hypothetical protein [Nitrospinota bacterium]